MTWQKITDDCLPPIEAPVWLWLPDIEQALIGCRTADCQAEGWLWARCYDDWYFDGSKYIATTAEEDDLRPSHWRPLPLPPAGGSK